MGILVLGVLVDSRALEESWASGLGNSCDGRNRLRKARKARKAIAPRSQARPTPLFQEASDRVLSIAYG